MSSDKNKSIVKKAQEILNSFGHQVKTGHLYELFSKLSNEASWNVANNKQVSFLDKVVNPAMLEHQENSLMMQSKKMYEESLKDQNKNQVVLGMLIPKNEQPSQLIQKKMEQEPNALFVGAMGSGKSVGVNGTILNYIQKNPDNSLVFILDPFKGAYDYKALFELPKVFPIINSELAIHRIITLIYDEAMARIEVFKKVQAENSTQYELKTGQKLDRILLVMEEFHAIPFHILNFDKDYKTPGTSANKFFQLMRIGRSLGIWVIAATQRATKTDVPPEIMANFTQKQVFRVSKAEASYLLGDTAAADIKPEEKGRCETDFGTVQFPFYSVDEQKKIVNQIKQGKFHNVLLNEKLIEDYISADSDKIYSLRKLSDYVKDISHYNLQLVLKRLHVDLGHKVELIDYTVDPYGIGLIVEWPNKGKIAIMFTEKLSGKHINKLAKGMDANKCERGLIYSLENDISTSLYKWAVESKIEIVDYEDLLRLTLQIEQKNEK